MSRIIYPDFDSFSMVSISLNKDVHVVYMAFGFSSIQGIEFLSLIERKIRSVIDFSLALKSFWLISVHYSVWNRETKIGEQEGRSFSNLESSLAYILSRILKTQSKCLWFLDDLIHDPVVSIKTTPFSIELYFKSGKVLNLGHTKAEEYIEMIYFSPLTFYWKFDNNRLMVLLKTDLVNFRFHVKHPHQMFLETPW